MGKKERESVLIYNYGGKWDVFKKQYIICNTVYCLLQVYNGNYDNVNILNSSMLLSLSIPLSCHKVTLKSSQ